jgi:hypothetical protein
MEKQKIQIFFTPAKEELDMDQKPVIMGCAPRQILVKPLSIKKMALSV